MKEEKDSLLEKIKWDGGDVQQGIATVGWSCCDRTVHSARGIICAGFARRLVLSRYHPEPVLEATGLGHWRIRGLHHVFGRSSDKTLMNQCFK